MKRISLRKLAALAALLMFLLSSAHTLIIVAAEAGTWTPIHNAGKTDIADGVQFTGAGDKVTSGLQLNEPVDLTKFKLKIDISGLAANTSVALALTNKPGYLFSAGANAADVQGVALSFNSSVAGQIWATPRYKLVDGADANLGATTLLSTASNTVADLGTIQEDGKTWLTINGGDKLAPGVNGWDASFADSLDTLFGVDTAALFPDGRAYVSVVRYSESFDAGAVKLTGLEGGVDPDAPPPAYSFTPIHNAGKTDIADGVQFTGAGDKVTSGLQLNEPVDLTKFKLKIDISGLAANTSVALALTNKPGYLFSAGANAADVQGVALSFNSSVAGQIWATPRYKLVDGADANLGATTLLSTTSNTVADLGTIQEDGKTWLTINGGDKLAPGVNGWDASFADSLDTLFGVDTAALFPDGQAYVSVVRYSESFDTGAVKLTGLEGVVIPDEPVDTAMSPADLVSNLDAVVSAEDLPANGMAGGWGLDDFTIVGVSGNAAYMHPGSSHDAARVLVVPEDGLLSVAPDRAYIQLSNAPGDNADGVKFLFMLQSGSAYTILKPQVTMPGGAAVEPDAEGWYATATTQMLTFAFANLPVSRDDRLYFVLNRNGSNADDQTAFVVDGLRLTDAAGTPLAAPAGSTAGYSAMVQGANNWRYEAVSVVTGTFGDEMAPADLQSGREADLIELPLSPGTAEEGYRLPDSGNEYCLIGYGSNAANMHPGVSYGSARVLVVPENGKLSLAADRSYFDMDTAVGDGVRFMFLHKSGTVHAVLYPLVESRLKAGGPKTAVEPDEQGWYGMNGTDNDVLYTFSFANLPVSAGDELYFLVDKKGNNEGDAAHNAVDGITLKKADGQILSLTNSTAGYTLVQGENNWRYLAVKVLRTVSPDDYETGGSTSQPADKPEWKPVTVSDMGSLRYFPSISQYQIPMEGGSFCSIENESGMHPGEGVAVARVFIAPEKGRARIKDDGASYIQKTLVDKSNGVRFRILRNDTVVYPTSGSDPWMLITDTGKHNLTLPDIALEEGDALSFVIDSNGDTSDDHADIVIDLSFAPEGVPYFKQANYNSHAAYSNVNGQGGWSYMYMSFAPFVRGSAPGERPTDSAHRPPYFPALPAGKREGDES